MMNYNQEAATLSTFQDQTYSNKCNSNLLTGQGISPKGHTTPKVLRTPLLSHKCRLNQEGHQPKTFAIEV